MKSLKKLIALMRARGFVGLLDLRVTTRGSRPLFEGWKMATWRRSPWQVPVTNAAAINFIEADRQVCELIDTRCLRLTQFEVLALTRAWARTGRAILDYLKWRHFIVFWSVSAATTSWRRTGSSASLVELGVCDGLTAHFASRALEERDRLDAELILVDSFEAEKSGQYQLLSETITRANVKHCPVAARVVRGWVPDVLTTVSLPHEIHWLHIDLNDGSATRQALARLGPRLAKGAVVLFDDYGGRGFESTQLAADDAVRDQGGILLPLPTGQAVWFH